MEGKHPEDIHPSECTICLDVHTTGGNGLSCFLYGGELPHVGGCALATPGAEIHGKRLSRCDVWTTPVPGHKDAIAAEKTAVRICLSVREPVSVCCGIHFDNLDTDGIAHVITICEQLTDAFLRRYNAEKTDGAAAAYHIIDRDIPAVPTPGNESSSYF